MLVALAIVTAAGAALLLIAAAFAVISLAVVVFRAIRAIIRRDAEYGGFMLRAGASLAIACGAVAISNVLGLPRQIGLVVDGKVPDDLLVSLLALIFLLLTLMLLVLGPPIALRLLAFSSGEGWGAAGFIGFTGGFYLLMNLAFMSHLDRIGQNHHSFWYLMTHPFGL